jgi:DinB family protein
MSGISKGKESDMHPLDTVAGVAEFGGNNLAYNLEFIPADKLGWKPAPGAKSALEIVRHVTGALTFMRPVLTGGAYTRGEIPLPADLQSAQEMIRRAARDYAAALRQVDPGRLGDMIELPFGTFPLAQCAGFPAFDVMHHHGQIAYIQTLLGDQEDHFQRG